MINRAKLSFNELVEINNQLLENGIKRKVKDIKVSQMPIVSNNNILYQTVCEFISDIKNVKIDIVSKNQFDVVLLKNQLDLSFRSY